MVGNVVKFYSEKITFLRGASEFDIQKELCVQASQSTTQDLKRGPDGARREVELPPSIHSVKQKQLFSTPVRTNGSVFCSMLL